MAASPRCNWTTARIWQNPMPSCGTWPTRPLTFRTTACNAHRSCNGCSSSSTSHEPYVATPRYIIRHLGRDHPRAAELPDRIARGHQALGVMEAHLAAHPFFVAHRFSIADIALYAYTHVAHESDIDLTPYPQIRAWLSRVASQSGHIHMTSA